ALHRLDDEGGRLLVDGGTGGGLVSVRYVLEPRHEGLEGLPVRPLARGAQRPVRLAVEAALRGDDLLAPRRGPGELQRSFHRRRTAMDRKRILQLPRSDCG